MRSVPSSARGARSARRLAPLLTLILAASSLLAIAPRATATGRADAPQRSVAGAASQPAAPSPIERSSVRAEQLPHATAAITASAPEIAPYDRPTGLPGSGRQTLGAAAGDFNGDGYLDLVLANFSPPSQIYLNDTHGGFDLPADLDQNPPENQQSTIRVAVADLNGDGALDIVLQSRDVNSLVYLGDGHGGFPTRREIPSGGSCGVAVGDLNNDRAPDLILAGCGSPTRVFRNNGSAQFTEQASTANSGPSTASMALGDLNGDGALDLVLGNDSGASQVYLNRGDGSGGFAAAAALSGSGPGTSDVAAGDLNGDGAPDLVLANSSGAGQIFLNNNDRSGGFATGVPFAGSGAGAGKVTMGDLNGDGALDMVLGNDSGASQVYLNQNDRSGSFAAPSPLANSGNQILRAVIADLNGDGALDIVQPKPFLTSQVYYNNGQGSFGAPSTLPNSRAGSAALGDLDGDGALDIVLDSQVFRNDRQGGFAPSSVLPNGGPGITGLAIGDVDGKDGLDIVQADIDRPSRVYLNNRRGEFPASFNLPSSGRDTRGVAMGDLNGDGALDVVLANSSFTGQDYLSQIYLNDRRGTFLEPFDLPGSGRSSDSVVLGDVDGDGALDIVLVNEAGPSQLYINNGNRGFRAPVDLFDSGNTSSLALGDLNGDGALDLVLASFNGNRQASLNNGLGGFEAPFGLSGGGGDDRGIAAADLNGDGALDLVFSDFNNGASSQVYLNDRRGGFGAPIDLPGSPGDALGVATGDLNGDGVRDIVLSNDGQQLSQIYLKPPLGSALPNRPTSIVVARPGPTPAADFFSTPAVLSGPTIPISYTLIDRESDPVREVRAFYSRDGGGSWRPALAATGTITQSLATSPAGTPHTFGWDVYASGFFGQSDSVVVRLVAIPDLHALPSSAAGPFLYGSAAAATLPFRARGSQVRVVQQGVPADPPIVPNRPYHAYLPLVLDRPDGSAPSGDQGALVYRIKPGQLGAPLRNPDSQPARTMSNGYLSGRDPLTLGDQLVALKPIAATDTYTVFLTSAAPTPAGLDTYTVRSSGVQTLTVSADHPLVLFNLSVALEWDAGADRQYQAQLEADLKRTSELLYSWTKGQAALGNITVYQDKQHWDTANIQLAASNHVRPNADVGGLLAGGQIRIGAVWNRYGETRGTLGEDWPRALAHELGHYAFNLEDNYLGLNAAGGLVLLDSCPGVMSNPYRADQGYYRPAGDWLPDCQQTLSNQSDGRADWQTIVEQLPWLRQPAATLAAMPTGPSFLPLAVTQVSFVAPATPSGALEPTLAYLTAQGRSIEPDERARAFLFQCPNVGACAGDQWGRLIDLGSPTLDQVQVRGARPGDRLCVFDLEARAPRLGCAPIGPGNTTLDLRQPDSWPPDIQITPISETSILVTAAGAPPGVALKARVYPISGPASNILALSATGAVTFTLSQPALDGYVHVWADGPAPRREIVSAYGLGGGPVRRSGGRGDAPVLSPDGQVILVAPNLKFTSQQFYTLGGATRTPPPPPGGRLVGQAYRLSASASAPDLSSASVNFSYLGRDVPAGQNNPDWLKIYFCPQSCPADGSGWQALPTDVDITTNNAVAPTRGPGLYALIIGIEIPLFQGVNYVVYPVPDAQPVRQALRSIAGAYSLVSTTSPGDGGRRRTFDPNLPDSDPRNTLTQLLPGNVYAITVSRNVILRLDAGSGGAAGAAAAQAAAAEAAAPATYDRPLAAGQDAAPGLPVVVRVSGAICGGGHTYERNGQLRAVVQIAGGLPHAGCSDLRQPLALQIGGRRSVQFSR